MGYQSFVIEIGDETNGEYPVTADFQGVTRTASIPADLPLLDDREITEAQAWLAQGFNDPEEAKDFGSRLFQILFPLPILEMFREAEQRVAPSDNLRLVLTVPDALAGLPWELLYDAWGRHGFLARSSTAPLVRRYTNVPFPNPPPREGPLRVLVVTAQPEDRDRLSAEQETEAIVAALKKGGSLRNQLRALWRYIKEPRTFPDLVRRLRQGRRFQVDEPLHHATRAALLKRIVQANEDDREYHVIHFVGHAEDGPRGPSLLLEQDGQSDPIDAEAFAEIIGEGMVNLVVLNACGTASASGLFQSIAEATLRRGVPAVIGMQVPILDSAAIDFSREFYRLWAAGAPIEAALAHARRLIRQQGWGAASDWSIPVLYLGQTPGLTLQPLERLRRFALPARLTKKAYGAVVGVLGAIMLFLAVPATARTIRTEVWPIRCWWPYPMDENKFAVAFNTFSVVDEEGAPVRSGDGRALADFLYERYALGFEDLGLDIPYELRPPSHTCAFSSGTRHERAKEAAELAERIHADVIIYGVLTSTLNTPQFALEYHVDYRGFEDAREIAGLHALGSPLDVELPFDPEALLAIENPPYLVRSDVLSLITIGLSYYSADNPGKALEYFERADQHPYWPSIDGKETIYVLLGKANVRLASIEFTTRPLSDARRYYERALEIDPHYVQAQLGLADALYLEALRDPIEPDPDLVEMQRVADAFQGAMQQAQAQGNQDVALKAQLGLGKTHLVLGLYGAPALLEKAEEETSGVIEGYKGGKEQLASVAGHGYAQLGRIALARGDTEGAIEQYGLAARISTPFYQAYYSWRLGEIYCLAGRFDDAVEAHEQALNRARLYGYRTSVELFAEKLTTLHESGCPPPEE